MLPRSDIPRLTALVAMAGALLMGGCASELPSPFAGVQPSYLGVAPAAAEDSRLSGASLAPRVSTSKVLSAIVFERVTGLEVDPARLVER
jgi:hypothetical protein